MHGLRPMLERQTQGTKFATKSRSLVNVFRIKNLQNTHLHSQDLELEV